MFCYYCSTWAVQLIREVFHWDISFNGWFRSFCHFWTS
jgi:hypothetical protein